MNWADIRAEFVRLGGDVESFDRVLFSGVEWYPRVRDGQDGYEIRRVPGGGWRWFLLDAEGKEVRKGDLIHLGRHGAVADAAWDCGKGELRDRLLYAIDK